MKITPVITILVFLLFAASALSLTEYTKTGSTNSYFQTNTNAFNTGKQSDCSSGDILCNTRPLTSPKQHPLAADLDNDGTVEIVVMDGGTVKIFHDYTLTPVDSVSVCATQERGLSNILLFDIDGDSFKEIVFRADCASPPADEENLTILNYSNGNLDLQHKSALQNKGDSVIACRGIDDCLIVVAEQFDYAAGTHYLRASPFNSTGSAQPNSIIHTQSSTGGFCMPKIKEMQIADYDNDGITEYILSYSQVTTGSSTNTIRINWLNVSQYSTVSSAVSVEKSAAISGFWTSTGATGCEAHKVGNLLTSPLVYDVDGFAGTKETIIAYNTDSNEFQFDLYDSNALFVDDFPEASEIDGTLISNMFLAKAHEDTDTYSFCVMGQDDGSGVLHSNEINIACGNTQSSFPTGASQTVQYTYDVTDLYNISKAYQNYNILTHSTGSVNDTYNGINFNEVLTSYGVLKLDGNTCSIFGNCDADLIWQNPKGDSAVIAADVQNSGLEDLIMISGNNLWYIDDNYRNSAPVIETITINPCIDRVWKQNTSVQVQVTASDVDSDQGDLVGFNFTLYRGTANEVNAVSGGYFASGTTITLFATANYTANNAIIRVNAFDLENATDYEERTFNVQNTGAVLNDCITSLDTGIEEETEGGLNASVLAALEADANDNLLVKTVTETNSFLKLGGTGTVLFLLLVINIFAFFFQKESFERNPRTTVTVLFMIDILILVLSAMIGIISWAFIIMLAVVSLAAVALWVGSILRRQPV